MNKLFGRKKGPQTAAAAPPPPPVEEVAARRPRDPNREMVRQTDRTMQRAKRDMQRERLRLDAEERKLEQQVKALGREGRLPEARMLAKNLVQVRKAKERTFNADARMDAISTQARMAQADSSMMKVMDGATSIMKNVNAVGMSGEKAQNLVMSYEMESEKQKLNQEMTDEVLDSILSGGEDIDAGTDEVLNSVLDEIGLEIESRGGEAPTVKPRQKTQAQSTLQQMNDEDLFKRLERLENP